MTGAGGYESIDYLIMIIICIIALACGWYALYTLKAGGQG